MCPMTNVGIGLAAMDWGSRMFGHTSKEPVKRWCHGCGTASSVDTFVCPECGGRMTNSEILPPQDRPGFNYSLSTLMLLMTLCCVLMGLIVSVPAAGAVVAFFAIPALGHCALKFSHGYRRQVEHPVKGFFITLGLLVMGVVGGVLCIASPIAAIIAFAQSRDASPEDSVAHYLVPIVFIIPFALGAALHIFASRRFDK